MGQFGLGAFGVESVTESSDSARKSDSTSVRLSSSNLAVVKRRESWHRKESAVVRYLPLRTSLKNPRNSVVTSSS